MGGRITIQPGAEPQRSALDSCLCEYLKTIKYSQKGKERAGDFLVRKRGCIRLSLPFLSNIGSLTFLHSIGARVFHPCKDYMYRQ